MVLPEARLPADVGIARGHIRDLGMKVPALAGLVCEAIDDCRAAFDEAREGRGAESREKVKRTALRLDRLILWTERVRKIASEVDPAAARITPPLAERLRIGLAIVVEMVSNGIDELQEALEDRASRPGPVGGMVSRLDRAIRWAIRLRGLVAGAKLEGARLPGGVVRRLEGKLPTLVGFVCAAVDDLSSAYDGDREPEVIDCVMSRLGRMLRWVERIRKLVTETKGPETKGPETKRLDTKAAGLPVRELRTPTGEGAEDRERPGAPSGSPPAETHGDGRPERSPTAAGDEAPDAVSVDSRPAGGPAPDAEPPPAPAPGISGGQAAPGAGSSHHGATETQRTAEHRGRSVHAAGSSTGMRLREGQEGEAETI